MISCSSSQAVSVAPVEAAFLVKPEIGVGKFEIGYQVESEAALEWAQDNGLELEFDFGGVGEPARPVEIVVGVTILSPAFSTIEGIGVGVSAEDVQKSLGDLPSSDIQDFHSDLVLQRLVSEGLILYLYEGVVVEMEVFLPNMVIKGW